MDDMLKDYKKMAEQILETIHYYGIDEDNDELHNILLELYVQAKNLLEAINGKENK